jgi:hypothetical protein
MSDPVMITIMGGPERTAFKDTLHKLAMFAGIRMAYGPPRSPSSRIKRWTVGISSVGGVGVIAAALHELGALSFLN